ncbi:hypothetical protein LX78_01880 [Xanthomarina spongicola]|uniref:Uncharacterized protein n=1 Tax=Xanthomarina spongicola TaxID=570520 RepID=A0A316DP86_9FLAO|nr:hypothetical protein LX78_01880 [Xanthomarina spongicola]
MGYRRGYYKKDGTYVQGHYTKSRSKSNTNKNKKGCASIIMTLLIFFSFTLYLINLL